MAYRILHISDLHAGPPFNQAAADALVRQAHELQADLLVISGDFVQRADFAAQWRTARALRAALPGPQLVVPGNHDVPLYNLFQRLFNPLGRYRKHISAELNPVFERPGLIVVGAATAHGLTRDGGLLNRAQAANLHRILAPHGPEVCKIVVWHHPVINPPGTRKSRVMRGARRATRLLDTCSVDLLLCGHLHVSYIGNTHDAVRGLNNGTIICQSGTTTSRRGFGREHGRNSCNLITVERQGITINPLLFNPVMRRFEYAAAHVFPRRAVSTARSEAMVSALELQR